MSEFALICIYLVISLLVSLIILGLLFHLLQRVRPIQTNCRPTNVVSILPVMPEVVSIYDCIFFRFYLLSLIRKLVLFPWAVPPNKIYPFGFWSMIAFLLILMIGSLYEWKRGGSDRE